MEAPFYRVNLRVGIVELFLFMSKTMLAGRLAQVLLLVWPTCLNASTAQYSSIHNAGQAKQKHNICMCQRRPLFNHWT